MIDRRAQVGSAIKSADRSVLNVPRQSHLEADAGRRKNLHDVSSKASCLFVRQMPGFRDYYLLDGGPDTLITISMFDSVYEAIES